MKPPKCRTCGKEHALGGCPEFQSTAARKDVQEAAGSTTVRDDGEKRSVDNRECSSDVGVGNHGRSVPSFADPERQAGTQALPVDASSKAKFDRNAYQREYMRKRRAKK